MTITVSSGPRQVEVPGLVGLTYDEAVDALDEVGLEAQRVEVFSQRPPGEVVNQNPKEGQRVDEGTEVEVRVSQGVRQVQVPDVLGQSESSARDELETAGFAVSVTQAPSDTTPEDLVSAQSPSPGAEADERALIQNAGLRQSVVFEDVTDPLQDGIVLDQDPGGGSQAPSGSTVTIAVGRFVVP